MNVSEILTPVLERLLAKNAENNGGQLTAGAEKFRVEMGIDSNLILKTCEGCGVEND
jgi:hypothetical protein